MPHFSAGIVENNYIKFAIIRQQMYTKALMYTYWLLKHYLNPSQKINKPLDYFAVII